jgi:hypothetical protein
MPDADSKVLDEWFDLRNNSERGFHIFLGTIISVKKDLKHG